MFRIQNLPAIRLEAGHRTAEAMQHIEKVVKDFSKLLDFDPNGVNTPTQAPAALNVTAANGIANIQVVDSFPTTTQPDHSHTISYIVEAALDPGFTQIVHTEDMGVSRNKNIFVGNQTLHFRVISQTIGSPPSTPTPAKQNPVACGGVAAPTQQTYQGSGTSKIAGQGMGTAPGNRVNPSKVLPL